MIAALLEAGFAGVEEEGGVIHARLAAASVEFTATAVGPGLWELALQWPVRATPRQIADWTAAHPGAEVDIWQGETRLRLRVAQDDPAALHRWAALSEAMVASAIRWRRAQRAPGEGM